MEALLALSALAGFYFCIRTMILSREIKELKEAFVTELFNAYSDNDSTKDSFLKFVSDSREWAFEYIENVQVQLKDFIDVADKEFSYFDEYGIITEGMPHYESMKIISNEYKKLKSLLPEESKND